MHYYPPLLNYKISLLQMEGGNMTEEFQNQLQGTNFHYHSETVILWSSGKGSGLGRLGRESHWKVFKGH